MIEQQRSLSRAEDMRSMRVSPDPAPDTPLAQANRSSSSDLESTDMAEIMNHPEISAAIGSGHLITAIKLVRAKTGLGLKQAKKLVDLHRH
ncbi:MAG: ribosomal protein L7/L12 [Erythrobacter sp.]